MNLNDKEIERMLSEAPKPRPPSSLKAALVREFKSTQMTSADAPGVTPRWSATQSRWGVWLNSWWPVVVTACLTLASLALMAVQNAEINRLSRSLPEPSGPKTLAVVAPGSARPVLAQATLDDRQDLQRLRLLVKQLQAEIAQLETLSAANDQMRLQIAAATGPTGGDGQTLDEQKAKASLIMCVNNLKQLGLAARVWATDNSDMLPPNILSMSNEIAAPKVLLCPSDVGRQPAVDWSSYTAANCSYEYLAASGTFTEPDRVMFRCGIHGNITLCDGSVQAEAAKKHPEWLVSRDGKTYFNAGPPTGTQLTAQSGEEPRPMTMDARMMMRYGLLVKDAKIVLTNANGGTDLVDPNAPPHVQGTNTGMDLRMMMRYGLLPAKGAEAPTAPEPPHAPNPQPGDAQDE